MRAAAAVDATVSKDLKVMRDVGLVAVRQDAQRHWYRLVPEPLIQIDDWLQPYQGAWAAAASTSSNDTSTGWSTDDRGERAARTGD